MKTISRALLRWITKYYPQPQLEIGRGMLTELEELEGLAALAWAFGGIQFYLELKGVRIMKQILSLSSLMILTFLASWLYVKHHLEFSIVVLGVGVVVAALTQPKQAFWCALIFAITLPVTHLTQAYVFSSTMVHELTANIAPDSIKLTLTSDKTQWTPTYITIDSMNSTPNFQVTGRLETEANNILKATYNPEITTWNNLDESFSLFDNQPFKLALFGLPNAFLLAGLTLILRSRFTKSPPLAM